MSDAWLEYLANLPGELGEQARALWMQLASMRSAVYGRDLPPPHAVLLESKLAMNWDNGPHHFEVEISAPGASCEWFYLHRETDRIEGGEDGLDALAIELLGLTTEGWVGP
jgi:hypothetical protein